MRLEIDEKTKRSIIIILCVGILLIIADLISGGTAGKVKMFESDGQIYIVRPQMGASPQSLDLTASIDGKGEQFRKKYSVIIEPIDDGKQVVARDESDKAKTMSDKEQMEYELRSITGAVNDDLAARTISLPGKLKSGASITWSREKHSNAPIIMLLIICTIVAVIYDKSNKIRQLRLRNRDSVMRQLPEFINKLVLLLNAGLVLNTAFETSIEESVADCGDNKDYFISSLKNILNSVRAANGSINHEFRQFAKSSGIKELMRVSAIISDNINKGVELNTKLEAESQMLWLERKKQCEERGRLAETKLTIPLVMLLMALIVITVAPAMLEL